MAIPNRCRFHVLLHPRPALLEPGPEVALRGRKVVGWRPRPGSVPAYWGASFDDAVAALARWDGCHCEPDGSLVWVGTDDAGARWQLDGQLTDGGPALLHVELRGTCPPAALDRLLALLGWPAIVPLCELPQEGLLLDEATFRQLFLPSAERPLGA